MEQTSIPANNSVIFVTNISPLANEKTVCDFFSFCGPISTLTLRKTADSSQEAIITFEQEAAAKTSLLLTNALIIDRPITVIRYDQSVVPKADASDRTFDKKDLENKTHSLPASERTQTSVIASLIAAGYKLGKDAVAKAREFDEQHQISLSIVNTAERLRTKAEELDRGYHISETAQALGKATTDKINTVDRQYGISNTFDSLCHQADNVIKQVETNPSVANAVSSLKSAGNTVSTYAEGVCAETSKYIQGQPTFKVATEKIQNVSDQVNNIVQETSALIKEVDEQRKPSEPSSSSASTTTPPVTTTTTTTSSSEEATKEIEQNKQSEAEGSDQQQKTN